MEWEAAWVWGSSRMKNSAIALSACRGTPIRNVRGPGENFIPIFFQGHDHLYVRQELHGLIYQEVPNPGDPTPDEVRAQNSD